jgi:RNA polymerase sigma-70 factor (ECF subfamily)
MDEKELIKRALSNREAFNEIVNLYYHEVFSYIYKRTLNKEDAKDLTQETFLKALKYLNSFKGNCPLVFWILRIATNVINDHFNREIKNSKLMKKLSSILSGEPSTSPDDFSDYTFLHKYIRELPPAQQTVITLIHFENRSMKEAALINGSSVSRTRRIYHAALDSLRKKMEEDVKNFKI